MKFDINRNKVSIAIAILMSLTLLGNTIISKQIVLKESMTNVVVAKDIIKENETINKEMITVVSVPISTVSEGIVTDPSKVIGLNTIVPIYPKEPLDINRLTTEAVDKSEDFSLQLVPVDTVLNLQPGTFVDIWLVPTPEGKKIGLNPEMIIRGHYVDDVKTVDGISLNDLKSMKPEELNGKKTAPAFLILNMNTTDLQLIANVNPTIHQVRVSLHKKNKLFEDYNNLIEHKPTDYVPTKIDLNEVEINTDAPEKKEDVIDQASQDVVQNNPLDEIVAQQSNQPKPNIEIKKEPVQIIQHKQETKKSPVDLESLGTKKEEETIKPQETVKSEDEDKILNDLLSNGSTAKSNQNTQGE